MNDDRRERGTGAIYFDTARDRFVAEVDIGIGAQGRRRRKRVTGRTRAQVVKKLRELRREVGASGPTAHRSITREEAHRFAAAALEVRNGVGLVLAMTPGLRPGELTALTWDDLDDATSALHVPRAWKDVGAHRRLGDPKTRRSIRAVTVPAT